MSPRYRYYTCLSSIALNRNKISASIFAVHYAGVRGIYNEWKAIRLKLDLERDGKSPYSAHMMTKKYL